MSFVGKDIPRRDSVDKVTGRARYVDDITVPGMWYGAVVRTSIPHGRVLGYKLDPAFDWNQVVIADANDIPGKNCVAMIEQDVPLIIDGITKHIGEAVLLVAAPTRELALEARSRVEVSYEEMEPVLSIDEAKEARVKIRGEDNIVSHYTIRKGDISLGFREADAIVEGTYSMGHQEHMYIETQGMIAVPRDDGGFDIIGSMQCPYYISKAISLTMGLPEEKFAIRQAVVGGAFGGKEDYPSILAGYCAVLAKKANRPVKIVYDRVEDTEVTTKRHPARVWHKTGVKKDGRITAMQVLVEMDAGAYATMTPVVLSRGLIHSAGPYRCDNVLLEGFAYATNNVHSGAFRGFGAPQVFFPLETHMDVIAERLSMSPLDFRRRNSLRKGDTTATGQAMDDSIACEEVLEEAARRSGFEEKFLEYSRRDGGVIRKGIGMSLFFHGAAFTGSGEEKIKALAGLRLEDDGRITILTACTDMGQGSHTALPQMVADFLNLDLSLIDIETPDTSLVPNSGPTVASRTTMIMGAVLGKCAVKLKDALFAFAAERFGRERKSFEFDGDKLISSSDEMAKVKNLIKAYLSQGGRREIVDHYDLPPGIKWDEGKHRGDAYPTYAWGCDVAEVEVDMDTFEIRVKKMWLAQDAGRAINPLSAKGQIEGGTLQSLGYGTMERHVFDGGRVATNRFQTYIIPTALDAPEMDTAVVEVPFAFGPMGAKGIGEMPMNGGAPAIANAVANATGIRICDLPVTPEKLYEAWNKVRNP